MRTSKLRHRDQRQSGERARIPGSRGERMVTQDPKTQGVSWGPGENPGAHDKIRERGGSQNQPNRDELSHLDGVSRFPAEVLLHRNSEWYQN